MSVLRNGIIFITAKKMIPLRNKLIEMGWPQPQTPIQTDNSTAVGFTSKTIVNKATKSSDMKLWWLRDRESQEQLRYYWGPGSENEGDYSTKHHPPIYHEAKRETHIWSNFLSFILCQLRQTKHSCKGVLLQVELLPRGTKRKPLIRRLSQQRHHYITC